jgi:hypothetical protein
MKKASGLLSDIFGFYCSGLEEQKKMKDRAICGLISLQGLLPVFSLPALQQL